jgi:hypothetical protein
MRDHQLGYPPVLEALYYWDRFEGYDLLEISSNYPLGVPNRVLAQCEAQAAAKWHPLRQFLPTGETKATRKDLDGIGRRGYIQKARIRDACRALAECTRVFLGVDYGDEKAPHA